LSSLSRELFLNNFHYNKKAKFISFAGYSMPINYNEGIIKENLHVRSSSGVFDVSHMGQILILASDKNIHNLEKFLPLDIKNFKNNKSYYSFILNLNGGVIDDIIISKITYNNNYYFFIVYNCSRKEEDEKIFKTHLSDYIILSENCLIAIQGHKSEQILNFLPKINHLSFMNSLTTTYQNKLIIVSRSGYTGEDGFEISIPNSVSHNFINDIMQNPNAKLCGLGSRDSLRLEAGLCLYGNELNEFTTPIEANLNWAIDKKRLNDKNLNGHKILLNQFINGSDKNKIGIKCVSKSILRNNMKLLDEKNIEIGIITSGAFSPTLKSSIGIGYIIKKMSIGQKIYTLIRNKVEELEIVKLPFILHNYKKG